MSDKETTSRSGSDDLHLVSKTLQRAEELTESLSRDAETVAGNESRESRRQQDRALRRSLQFTESMTPQGLLLAWKRRWKQAVIFGVPLAVVMTIAAWMAMPAPYTAYALLKVAAKEPRLVFKTAEDESDFFTFRKTQGALIKSRFVLTAALRQEGIAELSTIRVLEHPVLWLEKNVVCDSYNSPEIIRIALSGDKPEELKLIVNAVKDAYLEEVVLADRKSRISRLNDLERIHKQTEDLVHQFEKRASDLAQQLGTGDSTALAFKHQMALEDFQELKEEHKRVRFEMMQEQIRQKSSGNLPADTVRSLSGDAQEEQFIDPRMAAALKRAEELKVMISRFEQQVVDPEHPTLVAWRQELEQMQAIARTGPADTAAADGTTPTRLNVLEKQEQLLSEELNKYSQMVENLGTRSFELELIKNEIEKKASVSDRVGSEMEALRIELMSPTRVTLLQEADVPKTRDTGKKQKMTAAAGIGALGAIWLLVAVVEFHTRRITDPRDLSQTMGLDLLGTLPSMPNRLFGLGGQSSATRVGMWNNALIESVDSVRSMVTHAGESSHPRVIMIASSGPGEGKTTFACQLASSLARSGRRTVLVDFDIRRPRMHELMDVRLEPGICEYLSDDLLIDTVVQTTTDPRLDVLPAGRLNDAALQRLARDGTADLFKQLRRDYDFVVVDSSPILYVADCAAVGRHVDGAIVVARSHLSRMPTVAVACDRLDKLEIPLLGSVLVGVRSSFGGEGYSYDYHYNNAEVTA